MDKTTKTLIVVVIVLVGALGVTTGFILQGHVFNNDNVTMSVNQTNNTATNSSNSEDQEVQQEKQTTTNKDNNKNDNKVKITASQAMQIATNTLSGYDIYGGSAHLPGTKDRPIWIVYLYNNDPNFKGESAGQCAVDAITGEFLG